MFIILLSCFAMNITILTSELLSKHHTSYLATLATLSPVGEHTQASLVACFERMTAQGTSIFVAIDEENDSIIGTVSVLIEHKFNRWWSRVAHLEDLAVHPTAQGKWVWSSLINTTMSFAQEQWCYKIILDADKDPTHISYYEKFGFVSCGAYMKKSFL